jgi:hypothetical protein
MPQSGQNEATTLHLVFTPLHDVAFVRSSNPEPKTPEAASFHQKVNIKK